MGDAASKVFLAAAFEEPATHSATATAGVDTRDAGGPATTPTSRSTLAPFRLRRHADYQKVYQAGRKQFSSSLAFFFRLRGPEEREAASGPRVGLTVPRALGNAVVRNRIKRRMREALRPQLALLYNGDAREVDLVLHPRKSVAEMDFAVLRAEVALVLGRVAAQAGKPALPPAPRPARRARKGAR